MPPLSLLVCLLLLTPTLSHTQHKPLRKTHTIPANLQGLSYLHYSLLQSNLRQGVT